MDSLGRQHCVVELEVEGLEGHARRDTGTLEPFLERIGFTASELILDKELGELEVTEFAWKCPVFGGLSTSTITDIMRVQFSGDYHHPLFSCYLCPEIRVHYIGHLHEHRYRCTNHVPNHFLTDSLPQNLLISRVLPHIFSPTVWSPLLH